MHLQGGCYCGDVRYAVLDKVFNRTTCHCNACRRLSGAANVSWLSVLQSDYRVTKGTPSRFRSSDHVTRTFCARCGTQLTYQRDDMPSELDVTICSLDEPGQVAPQDHTFVRYRLAWDKYEDGLPEYQNTRAEG